MMITYDDREFSQDRALGSRHVWRWCWPGEREEWGINVGGSTTAPDNKGVKSEANKARLTFTSVKDASDDTGSANLARLADGLVI